MAETVFLRKATGLVREVGLKSGILFNVTQATNLCSAAIMLPYFLMYSNSSNIWVGLAIGLIGGLFINSVYAHFTSAMPRSGGDYVFLSRSINPMLGFVVNWTMITVFVFWWVFAQIFMVDMSHTILASVFPAESVAWLAEPWAIFAITAIFMTVHAIIALTGMKWYVRLQTAVWILVAVAIVIWTGTIIIVTANGTFPSLFNSWALRYVPTEPDMYNKIIGDAAAAGFSLLPRESGNFEQTLAWAAITLSYICPYGIVTSYVAGEVKKAESGLRQHILMEAAAIIYVVVFILVAWSFLNMVGLNELASFAFLGHVEGLPLNISAWTWSYVFLPNWWLATFFVVVSLLTYDLAMLNYALVIDRCMLAWSFDRILSTRFAHMSDRYKSPTYAIAALYVVGLIILALAVGVNVWVYIAAASFWSIVNLAIVCFAGMIFPYLRKDMFEQMPIKARIAGIPVLSIVSILGLVFIIGTGTAYFTNGPFFASFGITTVNMVITIVIYAMGVVIFHASRAYWRTKGINLDLAFKEIPPP